MSSLPGQDRPGTADALRGLTVHPPHSRAGPAVWPVWRGLQSLQATELENWRSTTVDDLGWYSGWGWPGKQGEVVVPPALNIGKTLAAPQAVKPAVGSSS